MVDGADNFVLTLRDVEERRDYYSRVLGMEVEEFEGGQRALKSGRQKINHHQSGAEFEPKAGESPRRVRETSASLSAFSWRESWSTSGHAASKLSKDPSRVPERPTG